MSAEDRHPESAPHEPGQWWACEHPERRVDDGVRFGLACDPCCMAMLATVIGEGGALRWAAARNEQRQEFVGNPASQAVTFRLEMGRPVPPWLEAAQA